MTKQMKLLPNFFKQSLRDIKRFRKIDDRQWVCHRLCSFIYYKCHKINQNCGRSYTDSPDWIKDKQAAINPINKKYNKCFQYAVTVALNHEETEKYSERITKIKPFINKYNWEGINFPSEKDYWKKIEKNNLKIAINVLYAKKEKI